MCTLFLLGYLHTHIHILHTPNLIRVTSHPHPTRHLGANHTPHHHAKLPQQHTLNNIMTHCHYFHTMSFEIDASAATNNLSPGNIWTPPPPPLLSLLSSLRMPASSRCVFALDLLVIVLRSNNDDRVNTVLRNNNTDKTVSKFEYSTPRVEEKSSSSSYVPTVLPFYHPTKHPSKQNARSVWWVIAHARTHAYILDSHLKHARPQ